MRNKLAILAVLLGCLLFWGTIPAAADEWNKKTTVTFSQPVELPGMILPPGTYVFKLLNSHTNRNIVLVYNEAENYLYTMILAINNYRLNPTGEAVLKFGERGRGNPEALRAWFYSNDNFGQEFVYPKAKAAEIAETAKVPVLTAELAPTETAEELIAAPVETVTPVLDDMDVDVAPQFEPPVLSAVPEVAEAIPPVEPIPELPHTATNWVPMILFMGLFALALAGVMKYTSRPH